MLKLMRMSLSFCTTALFTCSALVVASCGGESTEDQSLDNQAGGVEPVANIVDNASLKSQDRRVSDPAGAASPKADEVYALDGGTGTNAEPPAANAAAVSFERTTISASAKGAAFLTVADMNKDGKPDVIASQFGQITGPSMPAGEVIVYHQGDSLSSWTPSPIIRTQDGLKFPNGTVPVDVNGDGALDLIVPGGFLACKVPVIGKDCGFLAWMEATGSTWKRHDIVKSGNKLFYHGAQFVDFDGDGIKDIVTVGENASGPIEAQWFKGTTTSDRFETKARTIGSGGGSFPSVRDIDGDGDLDVISAEYFVKKESVVWFERTADPTPQKPAGVFARHVVDGTSGASILFRFVDNLYGDGVTRGVLANHTNTRSNSGDPESAVFVLDLPTTAHTGPWAAPVKISTGIVSDASGMFAKMGAPGAFDTGDVDGDGDIDILVSGDGDPHVYWIEQTGVGKWTTHILESNVRQAGGVRIADLDGDGKNELLVPVYESNVIYLYRRK